MTRACILQDNQDQTGKLPGTQMCTVRYKNKSIAIITVVIDYETWNEN